VFRYSSRRKNQRNNHSYGGQQKQSPQRCLPRLASLTGEYLHCPLSSARMLDTLVYSVNQPPRLYATSFCFPSCQAEIDSPAPRVGARGCQSRVRRCEGYSTEGCAKRLKRVWFPGARAGARIRLNGKGKGGYGHRFVTPSYTVRTRLYMLLQSNVSPLQDVVGGLGTE